MSEKIKPAARTVGNADYAEILATEDIPAGVSLYTAEQVKPLVEALREMNRAYVNVLETGRDRIIDLGGECDSVEEMEAGSRSLIDSKAELAKWEGV